MIILINFSRTGYTSMTVLRTYHRGILWTQGKQASSRFSLNDLHPANTGGCKCLHGVADCCETASHERWLYVESVTSTLIRHSGIIGFLYQQGDGKIYFRMFLLETVYHVLAIKHPQKLCFINNIWKINRSACKWYVWDCETILLKNF